MASNFENRTKPLPPAPAGPKVFGSSITPVHENSFAHKGRGAVSNPAGRYEVLRRVDLPDDWNDASPGSTGCAEVDAVQDKAGRRTHCFEDTARTIITRNHSPDIHFDRSINPYRGCEHGCIYCFARPTHTYLGHSAGLDFERILYAKKAAASLLRKELAKPSYRCEPIAIGVNTDAYQPLEKKLRITRQVLQLLSDCRHPAYLITKSALIERDIDILQHMAEDSLVTVNISITTLDPELARLMEPRAASPHRRLRTLQALADAGIPVRVSMSPLIPALNEPEIENLIQQASQAGATAASFILLRLPHELSTLFPEWLALHFPDKAAKVINALKSMRNNRLNDPGFTSRMRGSGPRAEIIQRRFELACRRAGIDANGREWDLCTEKFIAPNSSPTGSGQLSLFGPG